MGRNRTQFAGAGWFRAAFYEPGFDCRRLPEMHGFEAIEVRLLDLAIDEGRFCTKARKSPHHTPLDVGRGDPGIQRLAHVHSAPDMMDLDLLVGSGELDDL